MGETPNVIQTFICPLLFNYMALHAYNTFSVFMWQQILQEDCWPKHVSTLPQCSHFFHKRSAPKKHSLADSLCPWPFMFTSQENEREGVVTMQLLSLGSFSNKEKATKLLISGLHSGGAKTVKTFLKAFKREV